MEPTAEDAASSAPGSITAASRRGSTAATGAESKDGEKTLAELLAVPEPAPLIPLLPPPNVVIYGAVYSGIPVFEMMCAGTALMRRRQDSFLNLTQILKVANVERGKRMAVLDAACRDGNKFERIQGGYGKYQGTWVPLETAMAVARHFHADKMLAPLLAFHPPSQPTSQMTQDAMRAANVAVRPAPPPQQLQQPRPPQNPHPQQYPQQINTSQPQRPSTPAQARPSTPQQSHAPVQIPYQPQQVQRPQPSHQQPVPVSSNAATSGPVAASSHSVPPPKRKEPEATTSTRGRPRRGARPTDLGESSSESSFDEDEEEEEFEDDGITPPPAARPPRTKRIRTTVNDSEDEDSRQEPQQAQTTAPRAAQPATTTHQTTAPSAPQQTAAPSIPFHKLSPARQSIERQRQILLSIFTGPALSSLPDFLTTANPGDAPLDTDLVIDDAGHTALHWAATLARTNIVESLLTSKLCTPSCTNSNGETPLMRAVLSTNNLEFNAFTGLLALLGRETLTVKDAKGRTVLHHACLGFGVRGHSAAAKYYIENVCRAARATTNENETEEERIRREGFLNVQDVNGDTAMNIAARLGGRAGVDVLLEAGADHRIPNHAGLRPTDFGMDDAFRGKKIVVVEEVKKGDDEDGKDDLLPVGTVGAQSDSVIKKANDLSREIQSLLSNLHKSFTAQIQAKKDLLNAKKKKAESLTQELATLERANQALTTQNARLPDLENRLFGVEQRLKEEIEKKAEEARAAMEVDLNKIISGSSRPASVKDDNGDTVMTNGNDSLLPLQQANNHITEESESTATTYLRAKIQIMTSHITKKEADNKLLSAQIQAIRTEDATHELNYKKIISMCCNLEVEQIDAAMLEVLLAAVESDDNGTGAIAPGSEPVVPPAPVLDTTMADVEGDDILAGLLDADQHQQVDAALDGLLFKVTSLSSI